MRTTALLLALGVLGSAGMAETGRAADEPAPIQDNSFLVEEAYNQEAGVVQHISTFTRARGGGWLYTFTQEWPAPGQRHQLSYSVPWEHLEGGGGSGAGDVAVNYRLQLVGDGAAPVAFAPRLSVLLPTGDEKQGRGSGAVGYQVNLPLSAALGRRFVTHWNAGATWVPGAKGAAGAEADLTSYSFAQSFVWLARPRLNFLLELAYAREEEVAGRGRTTVGDSFFLNPGVRWAWDLPNDLQVVPGLAFTLGTGPSAGERAAFFYLSFEHPF